MAGQLTNVNTAYHCYRAAIGTLTVSIGLLTNLSAAASRAPSPQTPAAVKEFIDHHCAVCHHPSNPPAGIDLTTLPFNLDNSETFNRWVRVHDAVRDGKMPPGDKAAVAQPDRTAFVNALSAPLIEHEQMRARVQGRAVLRRLNRYEYENSIRVLLSAPWLHLRDALPEDGLVHRLNKSGHALDVSHVQMARYMEAAEEAIHLVVSAANQPEVQTRYYARDQKRFIGRMRYSPFNHHPERAMIPILGFDAQPNVLAEKAPISVGEADPKTRELEGFATPASTFNGNEYSFDQFNAPSGGRYHLRLNAYSIWIHTLWGTAGMKDRKPWWHPDCVDPGTSLGSDRLDSSGRPIAGTGNFGVISSTRTAMRQLQFSLKLVF